jgi:hypothetical protein
MQVGNIWRVQIVWPNGSIHYFGTFTSEESAVAWIKAHAWLTVRPNLPATIPPNRGARQQESDDGPNQV